MKLIFLSLLFVVLAGSVLARLNDKTVETQAQLDASTSIRSQTECINKNRIASPIATVRIDLNLDITYKNTGSSPIILDKRGGTIWRYKIHKKSSDSSVGDLEQEIEFELFSTRESEVEGNTPSKYFTVIDKGGLFTDQSEIRLIFDLPDEYMGYGNSEHFINFFLFTADGKLSEKNDLSELRKRWSPIGYFWFENITTKPMLIRFPDYKNLTVCKN